MGENFNNPFNRYINQISIKHYFNQIGSLCRVNSINNIFYMYQIDPSGSPGRSKSIKKIKSDHGKIISDHSEKSGRENTTYSENSTPITPTPNSAELLGEGKKCTAEEESNQ